MSRLTRCLVADSALRQLEEQGIVTQPAVLRRNRTFVAREVIDVLEGQGG